MTLFSPTPYWFEERDRLFALWELASSGDGFFHQMFAADAYRALQHWMGMRP